MLHMPAHHTWAREVVWPWRTPWFWRIASAQRTASSAHLKGTSEGAGLESTGSSSRVAPQHKPGSCRSPPVTLRCVSEEIRCFATAIDHSFRCRSRFISVKLKPSRPRSTLWPPCCPKRCPSPNQRGKVKRGQSTILDKGLMLRTPEPELVAGRNGSADRRPGE